MTAVPRLPGLARLKDENNQVLEGSCRPRSIDEHE